MQLIDLFSGIGGFSLAGHTLGWETVQFVEINPFCQQVLNYHFPGVPLHSDIKTFGLEELKKTNWNPAVCTILSGGFPCQPYSIVGKRKGKADERHLWPEMLRTIKEIQPDWVVGENVYGLLNWNKGMVLHEIKADLEAAGYYVMPPCILPACGTNAPHKRYRVWIIAHSRCDGHELRKLRQDRYAESEVGSEKNKRERIRGNARRIGEQGIAPDTDKQGRKERKQTGGRQNEEEIKTGMEFGAERQGINGITPDTPTDGLEGRTNHGGCNKSKPITGEEPARLLPHPWENFPTQSPLCNGNDGISSRLSGITFSAWRIESIKAAGNSIVPQVALNIFKTIQNIEDGNM